MVPRDLRGELGRFNGYAPSWRPQEGDILVGMIESYGIRTTEYGQVRTVTILDEEADDADDPRVTVWLSRTVLRGCFENQAPQVGDRIGIKYAGMHETKGYHLYHLKVDKPAESVSKGGKVDPNDLPLDGFDTPADDDDDISF